MPTCPEKQFTPKEKIQNKFFAIFKSYIFINFLVADKGNGRQPACPGVWKKCKGEHEW
jgi:hypothetical protein